MDALATIDNQRLPTDATVTSFTVTDGLSHAFEARVRFKTLTALELDPFLDTAFVLCLTAVRRDEPARFFHGVVDEASYLGADGLTHHYRCILRPKLSGLRHRVRSRIFQAQTVVDIVSQVLDESGIPSDDVRWALSREYSPREYTCQYKESELAFVMRLLEEEGIAFWHQHEDARHVLTLSDGGFESMAGEPSLVHRQQSAQEVESFWDAQLSARAVHEAYRSRDFAHTLPSAPLEVEVEGEGTRALYEYPGGYADSDRGGELAQVRFEEAGRERVVLRATSDCLRVAPGQKLTLGGLGAAFEAEQLIVEVEHRYENPEGNRQGRYANDFRAMPSALTYRPPRITPRPRIDGVESAVVTGPSGQEIHVDDLGRIKVHFYWDREGALDETSSCWIRFQQLNVGGAMILPRVGWEVQVAFLDGNPDRPVALHKVNNDETMPPYALPANKTQSALQSATSPGGGSTNEIRYEDANDKMLWFLHASRDLAVAVAHDEQETVGVNAIESSGGTYETNVQGKETQTVGGNQSLTVTNDVSCSTVGKHTITVGGTEDTGISKNFDFVTRGDRTESIGTLMTVLANSVVETFGKNHTREVGAVLSLTSATSIAETVGADKTETVTAAKAIVTTGPYEEQVSGFKTLSSGAASISATGDVSHTAKGAYALTSVAGITLQCGAELAMAGGSVRISSLSAQLKAGGSKVDLGASMTIDAKKLGADGGPMLTLKGKIDYK